MPIGVAGPRDKGQSDRLFVVESSCTPALGVEGAGYFDRMDEDTTSIIEDEGTTWLLAVWHPSGLRQGDRIVGLDRAKLSTPAEVRSVTFDDEVDPGGRTWQVELDCGIGEHGDEASCKVVRRGK
ncbi:hypothetical protein NHL50_13360 [Acidimicrobiia bacterium EGI L10123]|uniref:hypothetical protein n=1 Tax=Salinilacustrithrix flava TaxID=2957203 RepID=UPI003D7C348A|nr:hypothetical protein [Acidimicrobiia bacterium EGI L10123]